LRRLLHGIVNRQRHSTASGSERVDCGQLEANQVATAPCTVEFLE
jgi:hypothetical protein